MFSVIGAITNQVIGWALPGLSASALYIAAGLLAIGVPAGWAYHKGAMGCAVALEAEKASCRLQISRLQSAADRSIADILSSVNEQTQSSGSVQQYCESNPGLCRSEGGQ